MRKCVVYAGQMSYEDNTNNNIENITKYTKIFHPMKLNLRQTAPVNVTPDTTRCLKSSIA